MAANRTVQYLSISLILFVMLTFVLAVTTYLFFKKQLDESDRAEAQTAAGVKLNEELTTLRQEHEKLREFIAGEAAKTFAQIEAEKNERFENEFPDFTLEDKSYSKLVDWLAESVRKREGQMDALRLDHERVLADKDKAIAAEKTAASRAAEGQQQAETAAREEKTQYDAARRAHEQQQQALAADHRKALDESTALKQLESEVAKAQQYLTPEQLKEFESKKDPAGKPDPKGQLDVLYKALRDRARTIEEQNRLLATLRAADKGLQATVMKSTPQDDRIDGFDGRVLTVDEAERTALVSCRSTGGMRPGLLLAVFDPDDPRPQLGAQKGLLEVIAVEGPTMARARIRRDSIRRPILGGDGVATSLWAPGAATEVAIVGFAQLDADAASDLDALRALVGRAGATAVDMVSPTTSLVVDAGIPHAAPGSEGKIPGWTKNDADRRIKQIKAARDMGIRVVSLDEMLDLLGLERADLETGRLPTRGDDGRSLPRRSAGVAY